MLGNKICQCMQDRWINLRSCVYFIYFCTFGNDYISIFIFDYVIQAIDLHPMDVNGMADPYLIIQLGKREENDKDNKQNNQLNPVFGKYVEVISTVSP